MLEAEEDVLVVGEAGTGQDAITLARELVPDIIF
jgi:YesN/AraC family two-component response regulator